MSRARRKEVAVVLERLRSDLRPDALEREIEPLLLGLHWNMPQAQALLDVIGRDESLRGTAIAAAQRCLEVPGPSGIGAWRALSRLEAREVRPQLVEALLDPGRTPVLHVAAVRLLGELGEESMAFDSFLICFVEQQLLTGKPQVAYEHARQAMRQPQPWRGRPPATRGQRRLSGVAGLEADPYEYRDMIAAVVGALGRRGRQSREVIPWLFECLKLWAVAERRQTLQALEALDPTTAELGQGIGELVHHAEARRDKDAGEVLETLTVMGLSSPRWLFPLLEELARSPAAASCLATVLAGYRVACKLSEPAPDWIGRLTAGELARLCELAACGEPVVELIALSVLVQVPGRTEEARGGLIALMQGRKTPPTITEAAALDVLAARFVGADVVRAVEAALARRPAHRDREVLEVIARNSARAQLDERCTVAALPDGWRFVATPFRIETPLGLHQGRLFVAAHRILFETPGGSTTTDEEQVGVLSLDPQNVTPPDLAPLPVALPVANTGAIEARRKLTLRSILDETLVFCLHVPFSEAESWGSRNYLLAFDPVRHVWELVVRREGELRPTPLPDRSPLSLADLGAVCYGEVVVWTDAQGRLQAVPDGTPYHLDNWEIAESVRDAARERAAAEQHLGWTAARIGQRGLEGRETWKVEAGGRTFKVQHAAGRLREVWPALGPGEKARLHCIGGLLVERPAPLLALALRVFPGRPGAAAGDGILLVPSKRRGG